MVKYEIFCIFLFNLKEWFSQKWLLFSPLQAIQDVDEFVSSSEQIWRNLALHHLLTNGSSAVNGCHQNERQTADKNITVIHKTTVHQLMSCELTSCMFVRNSVLLVNNCDVLISSLDSHSDGTHSLQMIHWWASDIMLHFSKSDEETNSSTSWMAWGWVHFQPILVFWVFLYCWVKELKLFL